MRDLLLLMLAVTSACTDDRGGGVTIPPRLDVGDIGSVAGEPVSAPMTAKVGVGFTVHIATAGCQARFEMTKVEGLEITPYDLRWDPEDYDDGCPIDMVDHDTNLTIDSAGVATVRIHVLEHGEPIEIARVVDVQP